MRTTAAFILALLLVPLLAYAGIDKPWQEDNGGGGKLPGASLLLGVIGGGFLVLQGLRNREPFGSIVVGAVLGFSLGAMVGFPVACAFR